MHYSILGFQEENVIGGAAVEASHPSTPLLDQPKRLDSLPRSRSTEQKMLGSSALQDGEPVETKKFIQNEGLDRFEVT